MYRLSSRSEERISGIRPILQVIIRKAIQAPDCPEDFGIPQYGGKRTAEDQAELYAIGRTVEMGRKPVTYVDGVRKKSNHQPKGDEDFGDAFDVYIYDHKTKRASWNVERLSTLANHIIKVAAANGVDLSWGGHWKTFKDYPHFEMKGLL
jgi:peptidoglycan L-alanyl-D-glutamate endopeptidase CwlK